jgi:hypothetical protein
MTNKPLDRLMFVQGGACFFCRQALPKAEASVEHLFASSNGGSNNDENCVACCKAINSLLGSMSLKEKFQVVLNQKGQFRCPNGSGTKTATPETSPPQATLKTPAVASNADRLAFVTANLKQRGSSRPRTLKTLTSTVVSLLPKDIPKTELDSLLQQLQLTGIVIINENKVTYAL